MSSSPQVYRVGLVGFGMVGRVFHGPLIAAHPRFRLTHVVERSSSTSKEFYPDVQIVRSLDELLATDVDVVVIGTPSGDHFAHAMAAIKAGKHVVVEKPFTATASEAEQLVAAAAEAKLVLTVFQNRRFDSDFLTVQRVVQQGLLGELTEVEIHYDRFRLALKDNWREHDAPGSGLLYDLGSHVIDQALLLVGEFPQAVFADLRKQRPNTKTVDFFSLDLRFASKPQLRVVVHGSMIVKTHGPRYTLHGTAGSFLKHGLDVQEDQLKRGILPKCVPGTNGQLADEAINAWGLEPASDKGVLDVFAGKVAIKGTVETERGNYLMFYSSLADALDNSQASLAPVQPTQARDVIRVIEMATKSAQEGRLVTAKEMGW